MFKNLMIYRLPEGWAPTLEAMESALDANRFVPCGASHELSAGWSPPRTEGDGPLVESVAGQRILKFMVETRSVPSATVRKKADEAAAHIEATTGRKPGRKELRDLRDDAKRALLPQAFSKLATAGVWFDLENRILAMDAGSQSRADSVITALVNAMPDCAPRLLNTQMTPQAAMAAWLTAGEADGNLQIERDCELKASSEDKAKVKYDRHTLDTDEIKQHIAQGKLPVRLALNWQGRVGFQLTESMALKRIVFLDVVFEGTSKEKEDGFDADAAIATGELSQLIPDLIDALGGELK